MAIGDKARAAGMDLVEASDDRRMGYQEDNRTRDYIAEYLARSVQNTSSADHDIFMRWDETNLRIVVRVDNVDIGYLALVGDISPLLLRLDSLESRIATLEDRP